MTIDIRNTRLELLPEKAVLFPDTSTLLIADLHFGKLSYFRRSGIAVPVRAEHQNIAELINLLNRIKPKRTIFLGDLFHSHYNEEWEAVGQVIKHFTTTVFELVPGNHDIMSAVQYERHGIIVHQGKLIFPPFILTHESLEKADSSYYNLAGHVHPGLKLRGKGRQSVTLPCFWFAKNVGVIPAFGVFTGLAKIKPKKSEKLYVIAEGKVLQVNA